MYLQQAVYRAAALGCLLVYGLGQTLAVERLDHGDEGGNVFYLVCLQMADHVPLDIFRQQGIFLLEFLRAVLPEETLSRIVGLAHHVGGVELRYGNQPHALRQRGQHLIEIILYERHFVCVFTVQIYIFF